MKTEQHDIDSQPRYEVAAMVIPPQQHSPTNEQAALDYAGILGGGEKVLIMLLQFPTKKKPLRFFFSERSVKVFLSPPHLIRKICQSLSGFA